jgi:hypothetical protein
MHMITKLVSEFLIIGNYWMFMVEMLGTCVHCKVTKSSDGGGKKDLNKHSWYGGPLTTIHNLKKQKLVNFLENCSSKVKHCLTSFSEFTADLCY